MADLGKAYVQIVPSAKGIEGSISKELNGEAQSAGDSAGNTVGSTLVSKIKGAIAAGAIAKALAETLTAGAEIQQSMGGIETLFKESASTVQQFATTAYQRAGVSANEYMEQVTSFSASLLSSLGGDTAKAASYADRAMTDMSDNANKFGTDIESIQNAYQGFAKQNYTMLDNLKLGYGGTKEEMQRLISDASKMTDAMDELGLSVDESDMSFGNIVNAISVVQKNMDITGTTAKEAATTFSGSFNSMKAAATDFLASLTGVTDSSGKAILSVSDSMANLLSSAFTFAFGNLIPMVVNIVANLPGAIIQGLQMGLPQLVAQVKTMADSIPKGFSDSVPSMVDAGVQSILSLVDTFSGCFEDLITIGGELVMNLLQGFFQAIPTFISYVPQLINRIADMIDTLRPKLLTIGINLLKTVGSGIIQVVPAILATFPDLIQSIFHLFAVANWLDVGASIILNIGNGINSLFESIPSILQSIAETAINFVKSVDWISLGLTIIRTVCTGIYTLATFIPNTLRSIGQSAWSAFRSIDWAGVGRSVIEFIKNAIVSVGSNIGNVLRNAGQSAWNAFRNISWVNLGTNIISGIASGIAGAVTNLVGTAIRACKKLTSSVKAFFGIHSPSTLMRDEIGQWLPAGIAVAIKTDDTVSNAIDDMAQNATAQARLAFGDIQNSLGFTATAVPATMDTVNNSTVVNQTINSAKVLTPHEIAKETQDMMRRLKWA